MKSIYKKIHFLCLFLLSLSFCIAQPDAKLSKQRDYYSNSVQEKVPNVYGYLEFDVVYQKMGIAEFPINDPSKVTLSWPNTNDLLGVGAYAEDIYYVFHIQQVGDLEVSHSFGTIDIETGETQQICSYSNAVPKLIDLSYDYSSNTMYALQQKSNGSALVTIDLPTGKITEIASLRLQMKTLACTLNGSLFSLGGDGALYKVNKQTGSLSAVGNTGISPISYHSMEFDHEHEKLYWSGVYFNAESHPVFFWTSIDTNTAKPSNLTPFANRSQIGGLYIPFNQTALGAPGKVSHLDIRVASQNLNQVDIQWKNPTIDSREKNLLSLSGIKIYRDRVLIQTIPSSELGAAMHWADPSVTPGMHTYRVRAFNDKGDGLVSTLRIFVGKDAPGHVENICVETKEGNAIITWEKPSIGLNHGWFDTTNVTYELMRFPDSLLLNTVSTTSFTDQNIQILQNYWYKITAVNAQGRGLESFSYPIAIGPSMQVPFHYAFYEPSIFNKFTIVDEDKDTKLWKRVSNVFDTISKVSYFNMDTANDYLFMPPFHFQDGKYYQLTFTFSGYGPTNPTNLRVVKGTQPKADKLSYLADYPNTITQYTEFLTKKVIFAGQQTDETSYIGYQVYGKHGYTTSIYQVALDEIPGNDLAALKISGNTIPNAQEECSFLVEIENRGAITQKNFKLQLLDPNNKILSETNITDSLQANTSKKFSIYWTPSKAENISIRCLVSTKQDEYPSNDTSSKLLVKIQAAGDLNTIKIGEEEKQSPFMPFAFSQKYSYTQNLYTKQELQKPGMIEKLAFLNSFKNTEKKHIRIYMGNTTLSNLEKIDKNSLTLVYDQETDFTKGNNTITLNLNKAFLYNGDNLCIAAENIGNSTLSSNQNLFYVSTISDTNRAYYIYGDSTKEKVYTPLLADAIFSLQTKNGGVLSGKTTYEQENLSNVRVFVNDHKVEKQTDSNGNYAFLYLPQGNHKITYSKFGYVDTNTTVYITKGSTLIRNINMEKRKQYKLTGKVTDLNAKPIAGATIYLSGYDTAISISDANGVFTFPAIFGSATYTIEINHPLYKNLSSIFHLEESPLELGSLKMEERPFPPYKVIAQKDKEKDFVKISCENLHTPYHKNQILDDSTFENGTCHNPNVNIMLGNKFANTDSGIITHVSIYGFRKADAIAGVSVGLYIFDQHRNPILYNVPVEIPADTWVDVPINNLCFSGDFYVMLCWKNADGSTNYLARDQNGPFSHASLDYEYKVKTGEWLENSGGNIEAGVYAIRAATILNGTTVGNAKTLNKQNVYRLLSDKENADTSWTLLGELSSSYPYYTDSNFSLLPQGIYQYAVKNIYTGINNISTPSFSNSIYLDMFTQATITVKSKPSTNEINEANGAKVTLRNTGNNMVTEQSKWVKDGKVVFDSIQKGNYHLSIVKEGFLSIEEDIQMPTKNLYSFGPYTLTEIIDSPKDLLLENTTNPKDKILHWNTNKMRYETFETHEDFAVNSPGTIGWKYIDGDNSETQSIAGVSYPHQGEKMAFMVFNSSTTTPSLRASNVDAIPHSGQNFLAGIAAIKGPNADYIISPKLFYTKNFYMVFSAKSFGYAYGTETIELGASLKSDSLKDFTFKKIDLYPAWDIINFTMPKETRYVCIKYASNNKMMAMIDDIYIGVEDPFSETTALINPIEALSIKALRHAGSAKSISKYEVYLDDILMGETNKEEFLLSNLTVGTHEAGVKTIYTSGSSQMSTIRFAIKGTNNDAISDTKNTKISIYPNPVNQILHIDGTFDQAEIIDFSGKVIYKTNNERSSISTQALPQGFYLLKTYGKNGCDINKFIIQH